MVALRMSICAVVLFLAAAPLPAQTLERLLQERQAEEEEIRTMPSEVADPSLDPLTGRLRLPPGERVERLRFSQDQPIDPDHYIVGPGDVLQLYIWGEFDLSYMLSVDPEGSIIIPTVRQLDVSGQTLTRVKERIHQAAAAKYPGVDISITLTSMRNFTVYATGAVLSYGSQIVHPTTRVSDLIDKVGGFVDELRGASVEEDVDGKRVTRVHQFQEEPVSRRAIQVHRQDGTLDMADLDMFRATGRMQFNPYLRMGDVIHVRYRQEEIHAYGAVNESGAQEFRPGDTVGDLITLAGGLSGGAPIDEVELWRFLPGSNETEIISLVPRGDQEKGLDDINGFPLQPQDMLFIRTRSEWQETPTVHIHGQVLYRGRYRIIPGDTRLRDVIEQAGGFSPAASLTNATVVRMAARRTADPEYQRLRELQSISGLADMSPEDRAYLRTKSLERRGLVAVDFVRLFHSEDENHNILMQGGDVIFIPELVNTVNVTGQVQHPGLLKYEPHLTVNDYLIQAGGFAWRANRRDARLIRSQTGMRENLRRDQIPEPGDEIWIPAKEHFDWWAFTQSTMRTVAEALTLVVLVRSF